jgi:hypothetical protein
MSSINGYRMNNGFLDVANLIGNPSFIRMLKKTCKKGGLLNQMSIVVHHRPADVKGGILFSNDYSCCYYNGCYNLQEHIRMHNHYLRKIHNCATLLTGDIELTQLTDKADPSDTALKSWKNARMSYWCRIMDPVCIGIQLIGA